ncbi:glutathione S-transferase [Cohaesibacter sp. ES.047]|uniref:glutathione S-transferase family protein n=1 Tax=Cohaesibacter sp. ES.047 TaxID=1798205 RepID=UPI000BB785DA|nr:glutathione binding-like protein [Cohaesibacter sp. ES.047]SNY91739.1 glutathione S-transferase [Cohaesibacter sp. ES.047]
MNDTNLLSAFPITNRWPASNPDVIQLYSFPTPNGVKISAALEELGLDYEPHLVTLSDEDVKSPEFLSLSPNNKIPALIDPNGPDGNPIGLFESGAILIYLGEKTGKLYGSNERERLQILQWLMFQMGGVGPMLGQLGFFYKFGGKDIEDPRPRERYVNETKRLLNVVNTQLEGKDWLVGDFSIADLAVAPWLATIEKFYEATEVTEFKSFENVVAYVERFNARPAAQKAWNIPSRS